MLAQIRLGEFALGKLFVRHLIWSVLAAAMSLSALWAQPTNFQNAEEHLKLAAHYPAHAVEHETDAKSHEDLARQYDKTEPRLAAEARHHAAHSQEADEALRSMAKLHQDLAKGHGSKK